MKQRNHFRDRKAFRICINEDDCQKFLDPSLCPNGSSCSKMETLATTATPTTNAGKLQTTTSTTSVHLLRSTTKPQCLHPISLTIEVAVDVAAAAGDSSTPSGENISMSDDETILENCPPAQ